MIRPLEQLRRRPWRRGTTERLVAASTFVGLLALIGLRSRGFILNIARYVGDARAQVLPPVGSGGHDWTEILSRWGALALDTRIAWVVNAVGAAGSWPHGGGWSRAGGSIASGVTSEVRWREEHEGQGFRHKEEAEEG